MAAFVSRIGDQDKAQNAPPQAMAPANVAPATEREMAKTTQTPIRPAPSAPASFGRCSTAGRTDATKSVQIAAGPVAARTRDSRLSGPPADRSNRVGKNRNAQFATPARSAMIARSAVTSIAAICQLPRRRTCPQGCRPWATAPRFRSRWRRLRQPPQAPAFATGSTTAEPGKAQAT